MERIGFTRTLRRRQGPADLPVVFRRPRWAARIYRQDLLNWCKYGVGAPRKYQLLYVPTQEVRWALNSVAKSPVICKVYQPGRFTVGSRPLHGPNVIIGGDWDIATVPVQENGIVERTVRKLESGASWESVGELRLMQKLIDLCGEEDGCRTYEDLIQRYKVLDALFKNMHASGRLDAHGLVNPGGFRERGGIGLAISRSGQLILADNGNHRFAAALFYGVALVPVCVQVVHEGFLKTGGWKEMRKRFAAERKRLAHAR